MTNRNQHVVSHKGRWAVKLAGATASKKVTRTQAEAIVVTPGHARQQQSELLIHNKKGRIRDCNSYGNDPFPPKG